MADTPTYEQYSRAELIGLLKLKNKKIDSQRSMLYQSKVKRERLQTKLIAGYKVVKENTKLKDVIKKLNLRIEQLLASGRNEPFTVKEFAPVIINTVIAYNKLKKDNYLTNEEMFFLILAHRNEWFYSSDVQIFNSDCWDINSRLLKSSFRICCTAGYFYSGKIGGKEYYYISSSGRKRLETLLKLMYETSSNT